MPKGKGMLDKGRISEAFQADVDGLPSDVTPEVERTEDIQRISITIPEEMLRVIDKYIFEQKQKGISINRSRFICETLKPEVKKVLSNMS